MDNNRPREGKLDARFDDLGEQTVKNMARPVQVYRARSDTAPGPAKDEPEAALPLPDKPSIAVLPFANMSGDEEQEYFADGIAEEVITGLSRFSWFFVIARNSSFSYKGTSPEPSRYGPGHFGGVKRLGSLRSHHDGQR